jgi:hypothetical protein
VVRFALILLLATVAVVLLGRAALDAFSSGDPADLHAAARSLVPSGLQLLLEQEGACVMLKEDPSCVTVYFASGRQGRSERLRLVENAARTGGWAKYSGPGSAGVTFVRGRYKAFVFVKDRNPSWRDACHRLRGYRFISECADSVLVEVKP